MTHSDQRESVKKIKSMLGTRIRQHEIAPKGFDRKFNDTKFLDNIDRLYLIHHACMEETCHLAELWDLDELADGVRTTFHGFRNIYESLVEVFVDKVEEIQNLKNSNRIRYIYTNPNVKPNPADMTLQEIDAARKLQSNILDAEKRDSFIHRKELERKEVRELFGEQGSGVEGFEMDFADNEESDIRKARNHRKLKDKVLELKKKLDKGEKIDYDGIKDPRIILELNNVIYEQMITENRDQQSILRQTLMEMENKDKIELSAPKELQRLIQITSRIADQFDIGNLGDSMPFTSQDFHNNLDDAERDVLRAFDSKQKGLMVKVIDLIKKSLLRPKAGVESMTTMTSKEIDLLAYNSNLLQQAPGSDLKRDMVNLKAEHGMMTKLLADARDRSRAFEDLCTEKQSQIEGLVNTVANLRSELNAEKTSTATLRSSINNMKSEIERHKPQGPAPAASTSDLSTQMQTLVNQMHVKTKELEELRRQFSDRSKAFDIIKNLAVRVGVVKGVGVQVNDTQMCKQLVEAVLDMMGQVQDDDVTNSEDFVGDGTHPTSMQIKAKLQAGRPGAKVVMVTIGIDTNDLANGIKSGQSPSFPAKSSTSPDTRRVMLSFFKIKPIEFRNTLQLKQSISLRSQSKLATIEELKPVEDLQPNKEESKPEVKHIGIQTEKVDFARADSEDRNHLKQSDNNERKLQKSPSIASKRLDSNSQKTLQKVDHKNSVPAIQIPKLLGQTGTKQPSSEAINALEANSKKEDPVISERTAPIANLEGSAEGHQQSILTVKNVHPRMPTNNSQTQEKKQNLNISPAASALIDSVFRSPVSQELIMSLHSLVRLHLAILQTPETAVWRRVGVSSRGFIITDERGLFFEGDRSILNDLAKAGQWTPNIDGSISGGQTTLKAGYQPGDTLIADYPPGHPLAKKASTRPPSPQMNSNRMFKQNGAYLFSKPNELAGINRKHPSFREGLRSIPKSKTDREQTHEIGEESTFKAPVPIEYDHEYDMPRNQSTITEGKAAARSGKVVRHRHQMSMGSVNSQIGIEEDPFNNSSVITSSQGGHYGGGTQRFQLPAIPDKIPENLNILAHNQHESEEFLERLYMSIGRPAIFAPKNANFGAIGMPIPLHPIQQAEFQHFKRKIRKFVQQHGGCGANCVHLKRFYEKFGYSYVPKYVLTRQSYALPILDIGKQGVRDHLLREQLLRDMQGKKVEEVKLVSKPIFF